MKRKNVSWKKYFIFILILSIPFSLIVIRLLAFKAGEEFQVSTYTNSHQQFPAVAMDEKGNFVIAWCSWGQDGSTGGVFAQRFNKKGKAIGSEFQVNTYTNSHQQFPAVAMDAKGNFVITWHSYGKDGSGYGIFAQRFNKKGKATGSEFQVNTYTKSAQHPAVAMDGTGNFVITWESYGGDGSLEGVFAQRFNKKGKAIGSEFQVNTYTNDDQSNPTVAMDEKGNFVITWHSYGQDGSMFGIFAQRFNKKGKAIGEEFQVNTYTNAQQLWPAIAMDKKGNFFITWESSGQDGSGYGIFAKMFQK